jgi:hypothetical protein
MFENAESDALAVVDSAETRRVIGLLTEHARCGATAKSWTGDGSCRGSRRMTCASPHPLHLPHCINPRVAIVDR